MNEADKAVLVHAAKILGDYQCRGDRRYEVAVAFEFAETAVTDALDADAGCYGQAESEMTRLIQWP